MYQEINPLIEIKIGMESGMENQSTVQLYQKNKNDLVEVIFIFDTVSKT